MRFSSSHEEDHLLFLILISVCLSRGHGGLTHAAVFMPIKTPGAAGGGNPGYFKYTEQIEPSKDFYKPHTAITSAIIYVSFKPSKDFYKHILASLISLVLLVSNPLRISTNWGKEKEVKRTRFVSNPLRIATNTNNADVSLLVTDFQTL